MVFPIIAISFQTSRDINVLFLTLQVLCAGGANCAHVAAGVARHAVLYHWVSERNIIPMSDIADTDGMPISSSPV